MPLSCLYKTITGNPVGFPSPPINPPDPTPEGDPGVSPIPDDIYESMSFSFDITYQCYELAGPVQTPISTSVELINYTSNATGIQCAQVNSTTLRISGVVSNVFTDAYYKFLMKDGTIKILGPNAKDYETLIEWSIPSTRIAPLNHTIVAKVTNLQDSSFEDKTNTFNHDVYWKLEPALEQFKALLSKKDA